MTFSVGIRGDRMMATDPAHVRPRTRDGRGELEYDAAVAPGITVTWDPATPRHCVGFRIDRGITVTNDRLAGVVDRTPWLRLAAVLMLDSCLYLPLNRSLLDAEIAATQVNAAATLQSDEPIRENLTRDALMRARRASRGMASYLERFLVDDRRPPQVLQAALGALSHCYATLATELRGVDSAFAAVTEAWRRLAAVERVAARKPAPPAAEASGGLPQDGNSMIDPRQLPARVVRLGPTAEAAEISVGPARWRDRPALKVRVAAFGNVSTYDDEADLGFRVVDRESGRVHSYGLLGDRASRDSTSFGDSGDRYFEGLVALPESVGAQDVRVDMYEVVGDHPTAVVGGDALRRVRAATLFLADWRALVADVRLWGAAASPAIRLRAIALRLTSGTANCSVGPLWAGGPSRADLARLVDLGDRALAARLRAAATGRAKPIPGDDGGAAALLASVSGPGDLLAAELAAAHGRSVPR